MRDFRWRAWLACRGKSSNSFLKRKLASRRHRRRRLCDGVLCPSAKPFPGSAESSFLQGRFTVQRPEDVERVVTNEREKQNARHGCGIFHVRSKIQFEKIRKPRQCR